ncbi:MAG: hypothetical protein M1833_000519 [Piccolia ochrophora]|nr:MAG: hypothetical protein M1833_000519 [Piccolia ochrophora]
MASDSSSNGSQDALQVRHRSGHAFSFTQQGTLDWVALSKATVSASVAVMSRLSGAGIDPFTIALGQAMASRFRLSALGEHRLSKALADLRSFSSYGDVLWFGFGIRHIVRTLATTVEGRSCVMLCASLAEVHSVDFSARVLADLVDLYRGPESNGLTPSLEQWASVVNACSGILSASAFSEVAEYMMGLAGSTFVSTINYPRTPGSQHMPRIVGNHRDMARALEAIARLSNGVIMSVRLVGGSECGWLAALAQWFFEIEVEIESADGTILLQRPNTSKQAQLVVVFEQKGGDKFESGVEITSQTYRIRDLTAESFLHRDPDNRCMSGRVPWENASQQTFGSAARNLFKQTAILGSAIGSAARIFQGLARAEPDASTEKFKDWCYYDDNCFGKGYVNFTMNLLPELMPLQHHTEPSLESSYSEAVGAYERAIAKLATLCDCKFCPYPKDPPSVFCLAKLAEVLIRTSLLLSVLSLDVTLLPTRAGLEYSYFSQSIYFEDRNIEIPWHQRHKTETLLDDSSFERILPRTIMLFTSRSIGPVIGTYIHESRSAVVVGGILCYLDFLRDISDRPEVALRWHVIPGRIELSSGRTFNVIQDPDRWTHPGKLLQPAKVDQSSALSHQLRIEANSFAQSAPKVDMVIEETSTVLVVHYAIDIPNQGHFLLKPDQMTRVIAESAGLIHCSRQACSELSPPFPTVLYARSLGRIAATHLGPAGCNVVVWQVPNTSVLRCLTLSHGELAFRDEYERWQGMLQIDECISCCIRAAIERLTANEHSVFVVQSV